MLEREMTSLRSAHLREYGVEQKTGHQALGTGDNTEKNQMETYEETNRLVL